MRTDRASDTLDFFQGEVERLSAALGEQSKKIADFKTANVTALPDSMDARRAQQEREEQRLLDLQREETALKNQRATRGLGLRAHRPRGEPGAVPRGGGAAEPAEPAPPAAGDLQAGEPANPRAPDPHRRPPEPRLPAAGVARGAGHRRPGGAAALGARRRARPDRRAAEVHRRRAGERSSRPSPTSPPRSRRRRRTR